MLYVLNYLVFVNSIVYQLHIKTIFVTDVVLLQTIYIIA